MGHNEPVIGLYITPLEVRAVEIDRNGPQNTLRAIAEWPASFPASIYDDASGIEDAVNDFAENARKFRQAFHVAARHASIALDTSLLFLEHVPVKHGLEKGALLERVSWELSQFFPNDDPKNFILDYHVMGSNAAQGYDEILAVAVRRKLISSLEQALRQAGLSVLLVDADHFSADVALRLNYPDIYMRYVALAGVKEMRLDISLLKNGVLESYQYHALTSRMDSVQLLGTLSREVPDLTSLLLYGPALDEDLLGQVRQASNGIVDAINPLRHVGIAEGPAHESQLTASSFRFAPAIGVALRRD